MRLAAVCSAILAVGAVSIARAQDDPRRTFAHAVQLHQSGDFEGAIREYRTVLKAEPSNFQAHSNLGAALAHEGRFSEAIVEYKGAILALQTPGTGGAQILFRLQQNLALAYYKSGEYKTAAKEFENAISLVGDDLNARLLAADCYLRLGDFSRVIAILMPIAETHPQDRAVIYLLGMALIRGGQPEKGQALVDQLLREGGSSEAHFLLGSVAFMAKDYPAAVKELGEAMKLNPELPSLYSYYGQALLFTGDPVGAADAFRKQLSTDANDYDANLQLAEILRYRREFTEARPLYERALTVHPSSAEARFGLASLDLAEKHPDVARQRLEEIIAKWPQYADAHASLASAYEQLGRKQDASRERAIAAKLQPASGTESGLATGSLAPDFSLKTADQAEEVRISMFRGVKPAILVFGSYTCPKFRSQVDALNALYDRYHDRAAFLLVYIREAHGSANWQSTVNQREGIEQADASSLAEKREYAASCLRKLKIHYPAVVDSLDDAIDKAYNGWPSRVYLIDAQGRIRFNSLLDQERFDVRALESALESNLTTSTRR